MKLLHIQNPQVFFLPDFQSFMIEALSTNTYMNVLEAFIELSKLIFNPNVGLFLTVDDSGKYHGMALIGNSTTPLSPGCLVMHIYNKGANGESRNLLISAIVGFAKAHGCTKIRGSDANGKPEAFARLFKRVGHATPRGQIFEFDFSEE